MDLSSNQKIVTFSKSHFSFLILEVYFSATKLCSGVDMSQNLALLLHAQIHSHVSIYGCV